MRDHVPDKAPAVSAQGLELDVDRMLVKPRPEVFTHSHPVGIGRDAALKLTLASLRTRKRQPLCAT